MGTLTRPTFIVLMALTWVMAKGDECNEPQISNGVVIGTQTLDAYFGRVTCLPGFQVVLLICTCDICGKMRMVLYCFYQFTIFVRDIFLTIA